MRDRETNIELVTRIMDFSKCGPMMQVFVIEAMAKYSETIKNADLSDWSDGVINPDQWRACAIEILKELEGK